MTSHQPAVNHAYLAKALPQGFGRRSSAEKVAQQMFGDNWAQHVAIECSNAVCQISPLTEDARQTLETIKSYKPSIPALPELSGSEKQIAWAIKIRAGLAEKYYASQPADFANVCKSTAGKKAKFWIDNRFKCFSEILAEAKPKARFTVDHDRKIVTIPYQPDEDSFGFASVFMQEVTTCLQRYAYTKDYAIEFKHGEIWSALNSNPKNETTAEVARLLNFLHVDLRNVFRRLRLDEHYQSDQMPELSTAAIWHDELKWRKADKSIPYGEFPKQARAALAANRELDNGRLPELPTERLLGLDAAHKERLWAWRIQAHQARDIARYYKLQTLASPRRDYPPLTPHELECEFMMGEIARNRLLKFADHTAKVHATVNSRFLRSAEMWARMIDRTGKFLFNVDWLADVVTRYAEIMEAGDPALRTQNSKFLHAVMRGEFAEINAIPEPAL